MKAQELRIGNWVNLHVLSEYRGGCWEEKQIRASEFYLLSDKPELAKPIPLTEQWLIDFGFYKSKNDWFRLTLFASNNVREIETIHLNLTSKTTSLFGDEALEACYIKEVEHVHQLQNLYFALTGEELQL